MDDGLYFVPLLIGALEDSDIEASLKNAFAEIDRRGLDDRYATGLQNFVCFMNEACLRHRNIERHFARELIVSLICESPEAAEEDRVASNWLQSCSEWRAERQGLIEGFGIDLEEFPLPTIQVFRDKQLLLETVMPHEGGCRHIENVIASQYMIRLDIGMTVWEGELTEGELLWSEAFGERDLEMAAQTTEMQQQPAREMLLLDGALRIRVFAGIENGSIEIQSGEQRPSA